MGKITKHDTATVSELTGLGGDQTDLINDDQIYSTETGKTLKQSIADGDIGGGVSELNDLTDVENSSPTDKHVLVYDGITDNRYENRQLSMGDLSSSSIDDLSDVDTTSSAPSVGDLLEWNGTNFVPYTPPTFFEIPLMSEWESYTPTFTAFGTVSNQEFWWRRVGDSVEIKGRFTSGTPSASEARISFPSGLTSDSTKIDTDGEVVGLCAINGTSSNPGAFNTFVEQSVSYITIVYRDSGTDGLTKRNANITVLAGSQCSVSAKIPIDGWDASSVGLNKTQIKIYNGSNITSNGTDVVTFNNLEQGKFYDIDIRVSGAFSGGDNFLGVAVVDSSNNIIMNTNLSDNPNRMNYSFKFNPSSANEETIKLRVVSSASANSALVGDGTLAASSWMQITELNYTEETTKFD